MKILITGSSGFIGKHLTEVLSVENEIYGIDTFELRNSKIKTVAADLLDIDQCKRIFREKQISQVDVIIHLASVLANSANLNDADVLNYNNTLSSNIASLAMILGAEKIINFSSSSVYPNMTGTFNESSQIDPSVNPDAIYGLSKFNSEMIIKKMLSAEKICLSNLRCVMVYGEGVNKTRIWPVMEAELKDKNTITVFGNGERIINQIQIKKLGEIVKKFVNGRYEGTYNISEENISLYALAERIIKQKGNTESKIVKVEKGNTSKFIVDISKLKKLQ